MTDSEQSVIERLDAAPITDLHVFHDAPVGYRAQMFVGVSSDDYNEFGEGAGTTVAQAIEGALDDVAERRRS